jgi:predicted Zn-dependent protease
MSAVWGPDTVERALAGATADDTVVIAQDSAQVNVRWAGSSLTTNGVTRDRSLTVVSVVGGRVGVASRDGVVDEAGVRELVAQAEATARDSEPAADARPLVGPDEAGSSTTAWDADLPEVGAADVAPFTGALAAVFDRARSEGWSLAGYGEQTVTTSWLGTSTGVRVRHDQPDGHATSTGRTPDGARSVWAGRHARKLAGVDVAGLGDELAQLLQWSQRRVDLPAGRYDTILPPTAVADFVIYALWSLAGRAADEGRSAFAKPGGGTRLGDRIAVPGLNLWSDPAEPGLETTPFTVVAAGDESSSVFDNGLPVGRTDWIADGVLSALVDSRASGSAAGRPFTPPPGNLVLDAGGSGSQAELVSRTEDGLLLTSLWYIREVDPQTLLLTGLTRDGVFRVEGGEVVGAVNNFRWNESPVDALSRISDSAGVEQTIPREWGDYWTLAKAAPLRIDGFNMSSVSQAT